MLAVYFDSIPTNSDIKDILSRVEKEESTPTFFINESIASKDIPFPVTKLTISDSEKKEIDKTILKRIVDFPNIKTGSSTIRSIYTIDGIDCWHYLKFRTYFKIRTNAYKQAIINKLLQKYSQLVYYSPDSLQSNNDRCTFMLTPQTIKSKPNYKTLIKYGCFLVIRTIVYLLKPIRNKVHTLIDCTLHRDYLGLDLKKKKGNYIIGYLIDKAPDNFLIINKRELPKFNGGATFSFGLNDIFLKKNTIPDEGIVMKAFLSLRIRGKIKKNITLLKKQIGQVNHNKLSGFDKEILEASKAFIPSINVFLLQWYAYQRFFSKHHKLLSVSTTDENSPLQKSILDAAKSIGLYTFGIQHGAIFENHAAYRHSQTDIENHVVPDYTAIWGDYAYKVLVDKCNYPKNSLIKVGQVRTDIIPKLRQSNFNHLIPQEFDNKKIVLFASQPIPDASLRYRAAEDVFQACKDRADLLLVLKPHPAEIHNLEYYTNIAKKVGCTNLFLATNLDLYISLAASDIVITCYSTVGAEAIYFNKPLIILDHLKQDLQEYYKKGVALRATNSVELNELIRLVLEKKESLNKESIKQYINTYSHKVDGKAANRFFDFISTISERKSP